MKLANDQRLVMSIRIDYTIHPGNRLETGVLSDKSLDPLSYLTKQSGNIIWITTDFPAI
jgi:hypothetical protein